MRKLLSIILILQGFRYLPHFFTVSRLLAWLQRPLTLSAATIGKNQYE